MMTYFTLTPVIIDENLKVRIALQATKICATLTVLVWVKLSLTGNFWLKKVQLTSLLSKHLRITLKAAIIGVESHA